MSKAPAPLRTKVSSFIPFPAPECAHNPGFASDMPRKLAKPRSRWLKRKVEFRHATVLAEETVRLLAPRPGEVYCDATVGGGGHAERILEASSPTGRLVGIDRDPAALEAARARLERFGERVTLVHG